jgi:hypothetical protein
MRIWMTESSETCDAWPGIVATARLRDQELRRNDNRTANSTTLFDTLQTAPIRHVLFLCRSVAELGLKAIR